MNYNISEILSLISHIHALSADFTSAKLPENLKFVSSHGYILYLLSIEQKMTLGELAKKINRNKSTTTSLIQKLEQNNLIKLEVNPEDTRSKIISLTKEGKKLNTLTAQISQNLLETSYKNFSDDEKQTLLSLLLKMNKNIEDELNLSK